MSTMESSPLPASNIINVPWEDQQMNTMGNLALLQVLDRKLAHTVKSPTSIETKDKLLRLLNWLATAFVRESKGDVVAAALSTQQGAVTLYLAANRGRSQPADLENTEEFSKQLRQAVRSFNPTSPSSVTLDDFVNWVMRTTADRLAQKVEALNQMCTTAEMSKYSFSDESAQELFRRLVVKRANSNSNINEDPRFVKYVQNWVVDAPKNDPTGSTSLVSLFTFLLTKLQEKSEKRPLKALVLGANEEIEGRVFVGLALVLVSSRFFKAITEAPLCCFSLEELSWLRKLKHRLWRVACYSDADLLSTIAFPTLCGVLGDNLTKFLDTGEGFNIVWVGDQPGVLPQDYAQASYTWPSTPSERLQTLLDLHTPDSDDLLSDPSFVNALENTWRVTVEPRLHCEIQLINYLEKNAISVVENMIGVSKLMCFACNEYMQELQRDRSYLWQYELPDCSRKYDYAWLVPRDACGDQVVQTIQNKLREELEHFVAEEKQRRANSGGS